MSTLSAWNQAGRPRGLTRIDGTPAMVSTVGMLDLNCLSLFSEDSRQRLLWFTPRAGTDTAEKLALLTVVGTQAMHTEPVR